LVEKGVVRSAVAEAPLDFAVDLLGLFAIML